MLSYTKCMCIRSESPNEYIYDYLYFVGLLMLANMDPVTTATLTFICDRHKNYVHWRK